MLIIIPYQIRITYAIERLIRVFYEMALRLTGEPARVHFSFTKIGRDRSPALPPDFENTVEFDSVTPTAPDVRRLASYIAHHGITSVFALDVALETPFLHDLRRAGV